MSVIIRGRDIFADEDLGGVHVMRIRDAVRGEPPRKPNRILALVAIMIIVGVLLYALRVTW